MALINCKECGHEMSEHASACPNCGCPNNLTKEDKRIAVEKRNKDENFIEIIIFVFVILGMLFVFICIPKIWNYFEGNKLLDSFGINTANNTIIVKKKSEDEVEDGVMNWLGFHKITEDNN